jgi:hypothetical protein
MNESFEYSPDIEPLSEVRQRVFEAATDPNLYSRWRPLGELIYSQALLKFIDEHLASGLLDRHRPSEILNSPFTDNYVGRGNAKYSPLNRRFGTVAGLFNLPDTDAAVLNSYNAPIRHFLIGLQKTPHQVAIENANRVRYSSLSVETEASFVAEIQQLLRDHPAKVVLPKKVGGSPLVRIIAMANYYGLTDGKRPTYERLGQLAESLGLAPGSLTGSGISGHITTGERFLRSEGIAVLDRYAKGR